MERKNCEVLGLCTEYLEAGPAAGTPLVILHGWGSQAERWKEVMIALEKKGVKATALDFPGFGGSATPKVPWGLDEYKNFALNFLRVLEIQKFYLLGHSFGGRVVITIASEGTAGLQKLILVSSAGVTPRKKIRIFAYKFATKIAKPFFSFFILRIFEDLAKKIIYKLSGSYDYYLQKGAMKETFKKVIEEDLTPYLTRIQVPTLIIWGREDKMTPLSDAYLMNEKIKNSKPIVIEGGDHSLHLQMPERLAFEIMKFLKL